MQTKHTYFATTPKGMETVLLEELKALGAKNVKQTRAGASFSGNLKLVYQVCLWSRIANRVLLPLLSFRATNPDELYQGVQQIHWEEHLDRQGSLAVDFQSSRSTITHTHYGALKVKDAVVDQFRNKYGIRPNVQLDCPDIRINVYVFKDEATVSLDLSGESLHRRGYRKEGVLAPLKENLAAAILIKAGWPKVANAGGALIDPMCGSGTLAIEAALMAADFAPGMLREHFGFLKWKQHHPTIWDELLMEAEAREGAGIKKLPPIFGYDVNPEAIQGALTNLERAGLTGFVHFERKKLAVCQPPKELRQNGLLVVNPPYGERIGKIRELKQLYANLGKQLKQYFQGWNAAVFTGNTELGKNIGLRATKKHTLYNGALKCSLLQFKI